MFAGHGLGPMNARFMATWLPVVLPAVFLFSHSALMAEGDSQLRPAEDRFGGAIDKIEAPSFRRHVIPLASKLGCSGRECHGSLQGRGGFQLSLFGYDFGSDHMALTADKENRIRVNLKEPEKSLVLQKPTRQVKHKGAEIFEKGSWEYNVWLKWIQGGAKMDVEETGAFDRLEVFPKEFVGKKVGDTLQIKVLAHWKDGTVEDVTGFTRFDTNDESVATVNELGEVKIVGKGDSHVVAFYDNGVLPLPVMLPVSEQVSSGTHLLSRRLSKRDGSSWRMCQDFLAATKDAISEQSSLHWPKQGIRTSNGECWTRNTLEWPNDASVCSLSQVLDPHAAERYSLSPKTCRGILERSSRRGRSLPSLLRQALEQVAQTTTKPEAIS